MDPKLQPVSISGRPTPLPGGTDSLAPDRNSVLRNTYWLLALSMLPVVAGAWLGMQLNFVALFRSAPIMTPLLMFAAMLGSLFVVTRLRNSGWGVVALFGFTFIAGVFLTPILTVAAGVRLPIRTARRISCHRLDITRDSLSWVLSGAPRAHARCPRIGESSDACQQSLR